MASSIPLLLAGSVVVHAHRSLDYDSLGIQLKEQHLLNYYGSRRSLNLHMRQIMARNDLVQSGEIEIGSWRYRYGSHFFSQLRLSPKEFVKVIVGE